MFSYDENATNSPLLRLPPEIRNRIWQLVMCNKAVHITDHRYMIGRFQCAVCQQCLSPEEEAQDRKQKNGKEQRNYQDAHESCAQALHLSALRACRQIHQEAALLPFQENIFIFLSLDVLVRLLNVLNPEQSRAVKSVGLLEEVAFYPASKGHVNHTALFDRRLQGLKSVVCFVEIQGGFSLGIRFGQRRTKELLQLWHLPITSTIFVTYRIEEPYYWTRRSANWPAVIAAAESWVGEIEGKLLETYDKTAEAGLRKDKVAKRKQETERKAEQVREREEQLAEQARLRKARNRTGGRLRALYG